MILYFFLLMDFVLSEKLEPQPIKQQQYSSLCIFVN